MLFRSLTKRLEKGNDNNKVTEKAKGNVNPVAGLNINSDEEDSDVEMAENDDVTNAAINLSKAQAAYEAAEAKAKALAEAKAKAAADAKGKAKAAAETVPEADAEALAEAEAAKKAAEEEDKMETQYDKIVDILPQELHYLVGPFASEGEIGRAHV